MAIPKRVVIGSGILQRLSCRWVETQSPGIRLVSGLLIFRLFTIDICPFGILHFVPYLPLCIFPFQLYADDNIFCRTLQLALYSRNSCKMKNHCSVSALLDDQHTIKSIITALSRSQQRSPSGNKLGGIRDRFKF